MPITSVQPWRVLIVESDETQRRSLRDIMLDEGFIVIACASAQEAQQILSDEEFCVVVVDDSLEDFLASQLVSWINAANRLTHCIIHTCNSSTPDAAAASPDAFCIVEKQGDPQILIKHVYRALSDVTTQRLGESQSRLHWMAQQMPTIVWSTDAQLRFRSVMGAAMQNLDLSPEQILGQTVEQILDPGKADLSPVDHHLQALAGESKDFQFEWKDRTFEAHVEPWYQNSQIIGCMGVALDITQRTEAERQSKRLEAELRQAQKLEAIGTLAGGVAHDFNNLLTAIVGYTELASRELSADHPALHSLAQVEEAARQAESVTRSLLTFTRKSQTQKEPTDLKITVHTAVKLMRRMMPASMEILEQFDDEPIWIDADATQIQQVVINLTVNARDAMSRGGQLSFDIQSIGQDSAPSGNSSETAADSPGSTHGWVVLSVRDTGAGMDEQVKAKLFDPFFTTKSADVGTGLGLSVTRNIVESHGGRIEVESQLGLGTTFEVYLPCCGSPLRTEQSHLGKSGASDTSGLSDSPKAPKNFTGRGLVLLADDNDYVRALMSSTLREGGYDVLETDDGVQVVEKFDQHPEEISVVILDLDLPGHNGLECARLIQERRRVPIVLVTGSVDMSAQWAQQVTEDKSMRLLLKPFRMDQLLELVARLSTSSI
jgi:PAS domain S-box-containing protein